MNKKTSFVKERASEGESEPELRFGHAGGAASAGRVAAVNFAVLLVGDPRPRLTGNAATWIRTAVETGRSKCCLLTERPQLHTLTRATAGQPPA